MRRTMWIVCVLCVVVGAACDKGKKPEDKAQAAATASQPMTQAAAASSVAPGSYEDWCDEHQVPKSMDTQCNPKLIAAFKATGDWCEEHQMPESQCKQCKPNLKIVRPPKK